MTNNKKNKILALLNHIADGMPLNPNIPSIAAISANKIIHPSISESPVPHAAGIKFSCLPRRKKQSEGQS
jgi:hypothetical protein